MVLSLADANSTNVSQAVFLKHFRAVRDATKAHDETGMAVARVKKAAKADGIDLGALKRIEAFRKLDPDEVEVHIRHVNQYATFLGMDLGTQAALPLPQEQPEQVEWEAGEAGYLAGKGGKLRSENPFKEGTPLFAMWDKQFVRGLKVLADQMGSKADAAKAKLEADKPAITSVADMRTTSRPPTTVPSPATRTTRGRKAGRASGERPREAAGAVH